jgi:hypothetical protein
MMLARKMEDRHGNSEVGCRSEEKISSPLADWNVAGRDCRRLGFSADFISRKAEQLGLPRRGGLRLADEAYLESEADKLNITPHELQHRIIDIVLRDKLITALDLPDDDEVKENELTRHEHSEAR